MAQESLREEPEPLRPGLPEALGMPQQLPEQMLVPEQRCQPSPSQRERLGQPRLALIQRQCPQEGWP
jgi:hypothetical protein